MMIFIGCSNPTFLDGPNGIFAPCATARLEAPDCTSAIRRSLQTDVGTLRFVLRETVDKSTGLRASNVYSTPLNPNVNLQRSRRPPDTELKGRWHERRSTLGIATVNDVHRQERLLPIQSVAACHGSAPSWQ